MLFVAMRDETITPTASGNGITFSQIHDIDNVQAQGGLTVLRGMSASPSTGTITVTHTGNIRPTSCIAVRFSGVDTSGTNGSGAIGNTATDTGPDPDDDDALISVTIDNSNNFAVFSAWSRSTAILDDPPASGETTILINQLFGTGTRPPAAKQRFSSISYLVQVVAEQGVIHGIRLAVPAACRVALRLT
jgi:hypothetical protein